MSVARYLMFSTKPAIDIVEYPDSRRSASAPVGTGRGSFATANALDYWDGE